MIPSGKHTKKRWKITIFNRFYGPCSIAILVYQRASLVINGNIMEYGHEKLHLNQFVGQSPGWDGYLLTPWPVGQKLILYSFGINGIIYVHQLRICHFCAGYLADWPQFKAVLFERSNKQNNLGYKFGTYSSYTHYIEIVWSHPVPSFVPAKNAFGNCTTPQLRCPDAIYFHITI